MYHLLERYYTRKYIGRLWHHCRQSSFPANRALGADVLRAVPFHGPQPTGCRHHGHAAGPGPSYPDCVARTDSILARVADRRFRVMGTPGHLPVPTGVTLEARTASQVR